VIDVLDIQLGWFLDALRRYKHFTLSRWGDGEWRSVLGEETGRANCDGHPYTEELTQELGDILRRRPRYMMGMLDLARAGWGDKIEGWIAANVPGGIDWIQADIFHRGAREGKLDDIVDSVRGRQVLIVGPKHLRGMDPLKYTKDVTGFPPYAMVVIPDRHAFDARKQIIDGVREIVEKQGPDLVVSISAGMTGEIIVDALHETHGGINTIVDFGALWDPLAGVLSRKYMRCGDACSCGEGRSDA
jgi:hypothetical protein